MASLVDKMDDLARKYIALANLDVSKSKEDPQLCRKLRDKFDLARVKDMNEVAVVTRATPVDPSGEYVTSPLVFFSVRRQVFVFVIAAEYFTCCNVNSLP
jgi:hypothetical protein